MTPGVTRVTPAPVGFLQGPTTEGQRGRPWPKRAVRNSSRATARRACRSSTTSRLYGAEKKIQLPFVMGVLADLSGKPAEPLPPVADRKFLEIDVDNFDEPHEGDEAARRVQVPNTLTGEGNLSVDITFESMDDFSPAAVARKVDALNKLLEARTQLANLLTYMDGKSGAEELIAKVLQDPALLQTLARAEAADEPACRSTDPSRAGGVAMAGAQTAQQARSRRAHARRRRVRRAAEQGVQAEDRRGARGRRAGGADARASRRSSQTAADLGDDVVQYDRGDHRRRSTRS